MELARYDATPQVVAGGLGEVGMGFRFPGSLTWFELVRMSHPGIGEIRTPADWSRLPPGVPVRVVSIGAGEGCVIRWASDEGLRGLSIPGHQGLLGLGDPLDGVRAGYVVVTDNTVRVAA